MICFIFGANIILTIENGRNGIRLGSASCPGAYYFAKYAPGLRRILLSFV